VQQQVEQCWSVWLEPEVKMLGDFQPVEDLMGKPKPV
jgi:UDP-N-acetylmuramate dehydrogenase